MHDELGGHPGPGTRARPRGRPRGTSARALEVIALELYSTVGFEETTVEDIAAARARIAASMAKASMTSETWRCQPCQERVSL